MKRSSSKLSVRILGIVLGIVAFVFALRTVRLPELGFALSSNLNGYLLLCVLAWIASILFQVWRWQVMLNAQSTVRFSAAVKLYIINRLTNLLFLFRAGEGVRVLAGAKQLGISVPYLIATIINERILNLLFLAVITFGLTFSLPFLRPFRLWLVTGFILGAVLVLLLSLRGEKSSCSDVTKRLPPTSGFLSNFFRKLFAGIMILRQPSVLQMVLLMSLASWCCLWLGIFSLLQNVQPTDGTLGALAVLLLINIAGILPLTPSSLGPFQWACILALSHFGVDQTDSVAFSLVLQGVRILAAALVGACVFGVEFSKSKTELEVAGERFAEKASL